MGTDQTLEYLEDLGTSEQTPEEKTIENINNMSRYEMASLYRNAPSGHPYFDTTLPYNEVFRKRFSELGGFSPEISKSIGWK